MYNIYWSTTISYVDSTEYDDSYVFFWQKKAHILFILILL